LTEQEWTASSMGRKGGQTRTEAKAAASRRNAKLGGRLRKPGKAFQVFFRLTDEHAALFQVDGKPRDVIERLIADAVESGWFTAQRAEGVT